MGPSRRTVRGGAQGGRDGWGGAAGRSETESKEGRAEQSSTVGAVLRRGGAGRRAGATDVAGQQGGAGRSARWAGRAAQDWLAELKAGGTGGTGWAGRGRASRGAVARGGPLY